jgi:rhodanese-related sulfurtransferase
VKTTDLDGLERLLADKDRTTYVLDVRDPEEYRAAHLPGGRSAPGGQLVQGTDSWVAVRHARIVLVDDTGVRARMTGGWLRQLGGWEVHVLEGGLEDGLEHGVPAVECPEAKAIRPDPIPPAALVAALESQTAAVVDLARSIDFRAGHIPGAIWGVRTRLAKLKPRLEGRKLVVVTGPDANLVKLAVPELQALLPAAQVRPLAGGNATWKADGLPLEADRRNPPDAECIDFYLRPYDRNDGVEEAMREYLSWEIDLVREVARDGDARFGQY